ncbi:MAG: hypothetical protein PHS82_13825 [Lachnospiraceae bacterium]|nr:hypothetical protein [Lachnospiraceae bacterium]
MGLSSLIRRNCKLFFKDKGMFFTSLITPIILLVLYVTFLGKVFHDSFAGAMPQGLSVDNSLLDAAVGGELVSSILAVCCVTVAFCSNLLMVQDKISGSVKDLTMAQVRRSTLAMSYFFGNQVSIETMYVILGTSVVLLIGLYVLYNAVRAKRKCQS